MGKSTGLWTSRSTRELFLWSMCHVKITLHEHIWTQNATFKKLKSDPVLRSHKSVQKVQYLMLQDSHPRLSVRPETPRFTQIVKLRDLALSCVVPGFTIPAHSGHLWQQHPGISAPETCKTFPFASSELLHALPQSSEINSPSLYEKNQFNQEHKCY